MTTSPPKNHLWVETADGSRTLFSERFQESCHSTSGAKAETLLHYLQGCQVREKIQHKDITILEVGFGLGVGFAITREELRSASFKFHFVSLEIDEELVLWVMDEFKLPFTREGQVLTAHFERGTLTVIIGDARTALPDYLANNQTHFDVIYQDAFSPKKNPTLWTRQWFDLLKSHSHDDVILSTYSASSSIRKSLIAAGWKVHKGEKFGPKRTSTRATLKGETDPDITLHLERSPTPALTDENVTEYANEK